MSRHLLVIGGQRCGTTYLHSLLEAHPEVAMARPARPEPKVFLSDELAGRGRAWYVATYFAHVTDETVLGEKSTSYLEDPLAPARAAAVLGEPAVVVQLRDPVVRAVSNWRFSTDNGLETRPLEEALRDNLEGRTPAWKPGSTSVSPFSYLERGRYAEQLRPWLERFPVHVTFLQELVDDDEALAGLYRALGVDPSFRPPSRDVVNASQEPAPDVPEELLAELREYFSEPDQELIRLLHRDLPWGGPRREEPQA